MIPIVLLGRGWSDLPPRSSRSCAWSSGPESPVVSSSWSVLSLRSVAFGRRVPRLVGSIRVVVLVVAQQPRFLGLHLFGPRGGIPQLDPVDGAVHQDLGLQPGEVPQGGRNGHPPLPVDLHLVGARSPQSGPIAVRLSRLGPCGHHRHLTVEFRRGPQGQTATDVLGQIPAPLEVGTELGRHDHPSLGVERMLVSAYKACHWLDLPRRSPNLRPRTPFYSISRHITPPDLPGQPPNAIYPPTVPPPARSSRASVGPRRSPGTKRKGVSRNED